MFENRKRLTATLLGAAGAIALLAACSGPVTIPITGAEVSEDGKTLTLNYSACDMEAMATSGETTETVRVYLMVDHVVPPSKNNCANEVKVTLDAPLGERKVIDWYTEVPIPVSAG